MIKNRAKVKQSVSFLHKGKEVTGIVTSSDWPQAVVRVPASQVEGVPANAPDIIVRVLHSELKEA